jgi:hypothetical protein
MDKPHERGLQPEENLMNPLTKRHGSRTARGVILATAGMALASGAVAIGASSASAAGPACNYNSQYNTCLWITETSPGSDVYNVHVGIDLNMNPQQAQDILARGGGFYAKAVGDDPSYDNFLFYLNRTTQTVTSEGLSADFDVTVSGAKLDEDWGDDEVYGTVGLTNPGWGTQYFNSGVIHGDF